ncbi:hypothetical protein MAFF211271_33900 (plasmid) [Ralstonia syzygii subsp. indonesiensis]|nr:hypothetical protein MAFF211271_33900 [Ralstonia pseudosolanacearum]
MGAIRHGGRAGQAEPVAKRKRAGAPDVPWRGGYNDMSCSSVEKRKSRGWLERGAGRTHCLQRAVIYMQMRIIINYGNRA